MQKPLSRAAAALLVALAVPVMSAHAQLGNMLNQGGGSNSSGGLGGSGGLGALGGSSISSGSIGNVAGLLQFCIKNNYLSGDSASSVSNSLTSKLPGGANSTDSSYQNGNKGILTAGNGSTLDLGGGGLKQAATKQVCDKVLSQGKSML